MSLVTEPWSLSRRRIRAVSMVIVVLAVSGCGNTASRGGTSATAESATIGVTYLSPNDRGQPIRLDGTTLTGAPWTSSTYAHQVLVVNIWASWCYPCGVEEPALVASAKRFALSGVQFVGIDEADTEGLAFTRFFAVPYPSLSDPTGEILRSVRGLVPPSAVPTTLVLDRDGRMAGRIIGSVTATGLSNLIRRVMGESTH